MSVRILSDDGSEIFQFENASALNAVLIAIMGAKFCTAPSSDFIFSRTIDEFAQALVNYLQTQDIKLAAGRTRKYAFEPISYWEHRHWLDPFLNYVAFYKDMHFEWAGLSNTQKDAIIARILVPRQLIDADFPAVRAIIDAFERPHEPEN